GRVNVGQALDREAVLDDIERITGKRPVGSRYDERKWSIVLPVELTQGISSLPGVVVGQRIQQPPSLPGFVLDRRCPTAIVREFLAGSFGADGWAPVLHRQGEHEDDAVLTAPAYSQTAKQEHVPQLRGVMDELVRLLGRCGVVTEGATIHV